ncbi:hypothetical protein tinsulaeT_11990 [Thalassotalea insulae]|uniref:DUF6701 domain-containing protein n=1 Tax=Thalassotalea insulae TaxID=2056778 RepID=A0ABQ6GRP8_9GAMM|nr:DUF6701 domain-containing protein [Thalassotalea insulae]GLX77859.1 hypothetical protein tinsulaeT_11990 [Thalassotalea insulae]
MGLAINIFIGGNASIATISRLTIAVVMLFMTLFSAIALAGKPSSTISFESSPEAGKLAINEINIVEGYIEFYVKQTVDINGWGLYYEGQGNNDGSVTLCSAPSGSSACIYNAGSYLVVEGASLHSTLEELIVLDESFRVVHYFRYANHDGQAGGNWQWETNDPDLSTIYYVNGDKNNLCAKPNGDLSVNNWGECTPTKGGDNNGDLIDCADIFPGNTTFAVNGSHSFFSFVDDSSCNGGACSPVNPFNVPTLPSLNPSGSFSSSSLIDGEYQYSGWGLADNSTISFSGGGTAVLYFNSSITIPSGTQLNVGGNPSNVLIIVNGSLVIQAGVDINANIYVAGSATIGDPNEGANVTGALSVAGAASVYGDGVYQFSPSYVNNMDSHGFCESSAVVIDHYEIIHDGNGLTCEAENITIRACTNSIGSACVESSEAISLDLVVTGVTHTVTSPVNYTGNSAVFVDVSYTVPEVVTLSIANASVAATNGFICNNGNAGDCNLTFSEAGFRFLYSSTNSEVIANQVSGDIFTDELKIQAVKNNDGVCEGIFTGDVALKLAQENVTPDNTNPGLSFQINDNDNIAKYPLFTSDVTLNFGSDSIATIVTPKYLDAGEIRLRASYSDGDINLVGGSQSFYVRPFQFNLYPKRSMDGSETEGQPLVETTANGKVHQKAGQVFDLKIQAVNKQGDFTTNYDGYSAELALQLIAPVSGENGTLKYGEGAAQSMPSSLSADDYNSLSPEIISFVDGVYQYSGMTYSEVGLLNLTIRESNSNSDKAQGSTPIGRFIPDHFKQTILVDEDNGINDNGKLTANHNTGCLSKHWVYSGQQTDSKGAIRYEIEPKLTITAKNANGNTTKNYINEFVKLSAKDISLAAPLTHDLAVTGVYPLLADNSVGVLSSFTEGQASFTFSDQHHFTYTRNDLSKVAPFIAKFEIPINTFEDSDQVSTLYNSIEHKQNPLFSSETPNGTTTIDNSLTVKFGRLAIDNAYGPETENLPVPMYTQYWDGNGFVTNTDDSCTTPIITGKDETGSIRSGGLVEWQYRLVDLDNTDSLITSDTNASVTGRFSSGVLALSDVNEFWFSAPNDNKQGSLEFEYQVPTWLQYDWVNAGGFDENPTATITFGLFRGNDRIISWREVVNNE